MSKETEKTTLPPGQIGASTTAEDKRRFEKVKPQKDESVFQLAMGDPDLIEAPLNVKARLLDDIPDGCDQEKYFYKWIHANPLEIPAKTRSLIDAYAGQPVTPQNHPKIEERRFTGQQYQVGDVVLWYFHRATAEAHFSDRREMARNRFLRANKSTKEKDGTRELSISELEKLRD